ncbi:MAG: radical SAM protein [Elusimicrobia bacterium]|nr:radical SAM protein [Elusimicrobiota bacterium]
MKVRPAAPQGGLTLVLTRRCPFRCGFCPQAFEEKDMAPRVLEAALRGLGPAAAGLGPIKLFGGEPLAKPSLVRRAVLLAKELDLKAGILLSTHGGLMNEGMRRFLAGHPEVEVAFGKASPWARRLPRVCLNFVLEPGQHPARALARMREALAFRFRSFNFLPVYFVPWSAKGLAELARSFRVLARLIKGLRKAGMPVEVKNLRRHGSVPLYNDGPCVDTDGTVYASNLVLAAGMEPHAGRLRLGHVSEPGRLAPPPSSAALKSILQAAFEPRALEGTLRADAMLTEFVHALR